MSGGVALAPWKWAQEQNINNAYAEYSGCEVVTAQHIRAERNKASYSHGHYIAQLSDNFYELGWLVRRADGSDYKDSYKGDLKSAVKFACKWGIPFDDLGDLR